jgi:hypothetical protein
VRRILLGSLGALWAFALPHAASAALVSVNQSQLTALSPTIVFSASQIGAYADLPYLVSGGSLKGTEIIFGSYFAGQHPQGVDPVTIGPPSAPGQPLALVYDQSDYIQVVNDAAAPSNPVLAGGPVTFRQPISILFTTPVPGLALTAGYLDKVGAVRIDAYDANGNEIGSVTNNVTGFENFGLLPNGPDISGITIQGTDPAGFGIDSIFLAQAVPEPTGLLTLLAGIASLTVIGRRLR